MAALGVSGVVLAGGLGRRMGGADKGLLDYRGQPLARRVAEHLAPQVDELFINANRNAEAYAAFGYPVIGDAVADFAGPLAGLHAALGAAAHPLVATAPCDSPFFPTDLVARLRERLLAEEAEVAVACADGRIHAAFCLCRRELLQPLGDYLAGGGRKVMDWQAGRRRVLVDFADGEAFRNLNTPADLA